MHDAQCVTVRPQCWQSSIEDAMLNIAHLWSAVQKSG